MCCKTPAAAHLVLFLYATRSFRTTIIEALRFAVAGALPPGKTAGQAFVHDPRSIGHSIVKANVKLRFTNKAGKTMVVVRSMELTQKKTTLSFKQLDGTVRLTDDNGVRQSMSHKCSELDRQIPMMLGVSKAIVSTLRILSGRGCTFVNSLSRKIDFRRDLADINPPLWTMRVRPFTARACHFLSPRRELLALARGRSAEEEV